MLCEIIRYVTYAERFQHTKKGLLGQSKFRSQTRTVVATENLSVREYCFNEIAILSLK